MSQAIRLPRAVLDADIIFSRVLHELMGRAADDLRLFARCCLELRRGALAVAS